MPVHDVQGRNVQRHLILTALSVACAAPLAGAQTDQRNIWEQQYRTRTPADIAAQFESETRPVFRHRAKIIELLDLRTGMNVAEIGAGSGFLSRMVAERVAPNGRAVATELDAKMVAYMSDRARSEGLTNFTAVRGQTTSTGLDSASMDAVLIVNTYSFFDRPAEMMRSVAKALRPGGLLVIVDFPRSGRGPSAEGVDARDVVSITTASGFEKIGEGAAIPGHYALKFRRR